MARVRKPSIELDLFEDTPALAESSSTAAAPAPPVAVPVPVPLVAASPVTPPTATQGDALSPGALLALTRAECIGRSVRLTTLLAPIIYQEVNEILRRLGGNWTCGGRSRDGLPNGHHAFPYDVAPMLAAVIASGRMPPKNPTAFWPTPDPLARQLVEWAELSDWMDEDIRILEPSAGQGALARAIRDAAPLARLDTVEILPLNAQMLRAQGFAVHEQDFLSFDPGPVYHHIIMNPPFSTQEPGGRDIYLRHIEHAFALLRPGGSLLAIAPASLRYRTDKRTTSLRRKALVQGSVEPLAAGSFSPSGTDVETVVVTMLNEDPSWRRRPRGGYVSWHAWQAALWAKNDSDLYPERLRIEGQIARGVLAAKSPALATAVRHYYERAQMILERIGTWVDLTEIDHRDLLQDFLEDAAEAASFAARPNRSRAA